MIGRTAARAAAAWDRFWFAPQSTAPMALVRISFGLVMTAWTVSVTPDLGAFYSELGLVPSQPRWETPLTILAWWDSSVAVTAVWLALLIASICLTVGYRSRLAAVVVFVALLSFHRRSPTTTNGGDVLLRLIAFYMMLAPAGASLSVDRWLRHRDAFWRFPARSRWPLRLLQVQVSILYLFSFFYKAISDEWTNGTAWGLIARLEDVRRLPIPDVITDQLILVNLATYGTLAVELALPILVWNRRTLPWAIAAGVALHVGIELTMTLGFFSMAIFVSYVAFVPPDVAERLALWVGRRLGRAPADGAAPAPLARPESEAPA